MKKLGLIVNPIAGMGGRVGLKGTDGEHIRRKALELGAAPQASKRAFEALSIISREMPGLSLIICGGPMGEDVAKCSGLESHAISGIPKDILATGLSDTRQAALRMQEMGVDLLLFAGGDGTARDICDSIASTKHPASRLPVLGIPAGVKMHSGVFALNPRRAAEIAVAFLRGESEEVAEAEVMDIDEEAFREGKVSATLHGYLITPADAGGIQSSKAGGASGNDSDVEGIARQVVSDMDDDTLYVLGPGTTTASIAKLLGIENTLLGVDVIRNGHLVASDLSERELLALTSGKPTKIVVSVIGGQGYILGRGNQQISPQVLRRVGKENIIAIATHAKLLALNGSPLLVDTGDPELDEELGGFTRVVTGYRQFHAYRVSC